MDKVSKGINNPEKYLTVRFAFLFCVYNEFAALSDFKFEIN